MHNFCNFQNIKGGGMRWASFFQILSEEEFSLILGPLVFESSFWRALWVPSEQLQAMTLPLPAFAEELRRPHHVSELQPPSARPRRDAQHHPGPWTTGAERRELFLSPSSGHQFGWEALTLSPRFLPLSWLFYFLSSSPFLSTPASLLPPDTSTLAHKHTSAEESMQSLLTTAPWSRGLFA